MMGISFRIGRKEDCAVLAELVSIASEGIIEFLFHDLISLTKEKAKETDFSSLSLIVLAGNADAQCFI
ncbi:hypothetical protein D1BOALGB6SA_7732 [Olavius sp. associated proteobacterium Delta 1]|nr:hypothetical protein D1BOALGB6SA_7732 [Olavius sp. associated proteobacterium Delta 1]